MEWAERKTFYNENFYTKTCTTVVNNQPLDHDLRSQVNLLIEILNPKTLLDCGCSTGALVKGFRSAGVEAYGFDLSEYALSHALPDAKPYLFLCDLALEKLPYPDDFFDTVTACDFLEHQDDEHLHHVLGEIIRVCKKRVFLRQPMVHFDDIAGRDKLVESLNHLTHLERLALVGKIKGVRDSIPVPNCPYHPQERSRSFWVKTFTDYGFSEVTLAEHFYHYPNPAHLSSVNILIFDK